ncbi:hypothetical protein WA158_000327 [Blastocystis sp. Blastoise]
MKTDNEGKKKVNKIYKVTKSPLCKEAWSTYLKSLTINTTVGLCLGALSAFVFFGKPTYRAAVTALFTGIGLGSGWTKNNISLKNEWHNYQLYKKQNKMM